MPESHFRCMKHTLLLHRVQATLPPKLEHTAPLLAVLVQELAVWMGIRVDAYSCNDAHKTLAPLVCAAMLDCFEREPANLRLEHGTLRSLHMCAPHTPLCSVLFC